MGLSSCLPTCSMLILQRRGFGERNFSSERMTSHLTGHKLEDFVKLNKLGEGTYGVVFKVWNENHLRIRPDLLLYQGQNKKTGEVVAMKKIKLESEDEGVGLMDC